MLLEIGKFYKNKRGDKVLLVNIFTSIEEKYRGHLTKENINLDSGHPYDTYALEEYGYIVNFYDEKGVCTYPVDPSCDLIMEWKEIN